jgi:hypothetical protein
VPAENFCSPGRRVNSRQYVISCLANVFTHCGSQPRVCLAKHSQFQMLLKLCWCDSGPTDIYSEEILLELRHPCQLAWLKLSTGFLVFLLSKPLFHGASSSSGYASLLKLHDHTQAHHIRYDFSGRVIGSAQRSLPDNQQRIRRHTHPCLLQDSNLLFQQASGRRPKQ